jgi:hypothetical protein
MPLSVQALPLIPIEIIISFGCALIALICCIGPFGSTPAKASSTLGATAAVAALLHLTIANSDLHTWFREQMKADSSALANNPFAGLAQQIANLAVNSVQLRPGAGLYVLASTLSLATIILLSKVHSASPTAEGIQPRPDQRIGYTGRYAFLVLLVFVAATAALVLTHKPQPGTESRGAMQSEPPTSKGSDIFKWPTEGLPAYIADALNTPDLSPITPKEAAKELTLGINGEKQIIPSVKDEDCMGSGGCVWDLIDAATKRGLIEGEQGALHRTDRITNGYFNLLIEGKLGLYLYEYSGGKYIETVCYERSDGQLGSPAKLTLCSAESSPVTTPKASMGYPVTEKTFVDAYVLANSGRDDLTDDQLERLGNDEYEMGRQIDTQTLLLGGDMLNTRGKRAMDYLDKLHRQQPQAQ